MSSVPDWRAQPFAAIGTGVIRIQPQGHPGADAGSHRPAGLCRRGAKGYLSRRFILRAEFNKYVVFTDRDDNEEADEWKLGFAFFF
jgi:hypothetical protein